jgi:hypothetical protein
MILNVLDTSPISNIGYQLLNEKGGDIEVSP